MALSKIKTNSLSDDAVTAAKIATGTIVAADLAANSVDSSELVDGSIDTSHIAASQVTNAKTDFQPGTTFKGDGSSTDGKITLNCSQNTHGVSIQSPAHASGATYTLTLPTSNGNANEFLQTNGSGVLTFATVGTSSLAADAITGAKIADDAIDSEHYTDGSIDLAHMSVNSIDSDQYVDGSIDTAHIADNQVTLAKMAGLARGKIIYGDASGDPAALTVGSNGQVLKSNGTDISWGTDSGGATLTGSTNNQVTTVTGADAFQGEANLTFDGSTLAVTGALTASTSGQFATLGVISAKDLGVGLHIRVNDTGGGVHADADAFVIEDTAHSGMTLLTSNSTESRINFGDADANRQGAIGYDHSSDVMNFYSNQSVHTLSMKAAEVVINEGSADLDFRVESNAQAHCLFVDAANDRIHVKTSTPSSSAVGWTIHGGNGVSQVCRDSGTPIEVCRVTSDGNMINFLKDGSEKGNVAVSGATINLWDRIGHN